MYCYPQVELTGDLVDQCIPGDLVTVSGVVKSMNAELAQGRTSKTAKASGLYLLYIKGNHILNSRRYGRIASSICVLHFPWQQYTDINGYCLRMSSRAAAVGGISTATVSRLQILERTSATTYYLTSLHPRMMMRNLLRQI